MKLITSALILALTGIAGAQAPTPPPPKPKVLKPAPSTTTKSKPKARTNPKPKPAEESTPEPANQPDLPPAESPQTAPQRPQATPTTPVADAPKRSRAAESAFSGYMPKVKAALGKGWAAAIQPRATEFQPGNVGVAFKIDASGAVTDVRITDNSSNEAFAKFCESYVRGIQFDAPPARALDNGAVEIPFTFSLY